MNSLELRKIREEEINHFERESNDDFARRVATAVDARSAAMASAQQRRSVLADMGDGVVWVRARSTVYHSSRFCGCMRRRDRVGEYVPMFEEEVVEGGHQPCQRCNHTTLRRIA